MEYKIKNEKPKSKNWSGLLKVYTVFGIFSCILGATFYTKTVQKILLGLSATCVFSSCAPINHNYALNVPKSIMPYVLQFELQAVLHGRNLRITDLTIQLENEMPGDAIGLCYSGTNAASPKIVLAKWYWNMASKMEKEVLLFHELGHCVLHLEHNNETNIEGMPESIMHYSVFDASYYEANRESYLKQLFGADTIGLYKETL